MARELRHPIRYRILGPFEVVDPSGKVIALGGRRQASVLAVLLLHADEVVTVDRLVDLLWPDGAPASAVGTVQAYVSNLRRLLEPERPARAPSSVLVSQSAGYRLVVGADALDSRSFEQLAEEAWELRATDPEASRRRYNEALALWRGPALVDFVYDEFARAEIARLEDRRISVQEELIDLRLDTGEHHQVVAELEALTTVHPLRERLWCQLIVALYRSGRQADALRAYQRIARSLAEELGVDPSPELRELELAVLQHDAALQADGPRRVPTRVRHSPPATARAVLVRPVIGRDEELDAFAAALDEARAGTGVVLLLEGEAGIGKTRLLQAMLGLADDAGALALRGRCVEGGGAPPLWPWIQILQGWSAAESLARLDATAHGVSSLLNVEVASEPLLHPLVLAQRIVAALDALPPGAVVVIGLDDVYGADPDSIMALTEIVDAVGRLPVVIIATYRTADLSDQHPLTAFLAQVSRLATVRRCALERFDLATTAKVVNESMGESLAPELIEEIHQRTGGNALFVVELARLLRSEDDVAAAVGRVPPGVREVIRRRVAQLDADTVSFLSVASVAGRTFSLDVVSEVGGHADGLDSVESALAAQLVEETDQTGSFRFSHVLVQESIAEGITATRRARLHQAIEQAMEHHHGQDPHHWALIAHHASEAVPVAGPARALEALARAAAHAFDSGAPALAAQLHERYLALLAMVPPSPERDVSEMQALVGLSRAVTAGLGWASARLGEAGGRILELARAADGRGPVLDGLMAVYGHSVVTAQLDDADAAVAAMDELAASSGDPMAQLCAGLCGAIDLRYRGRPVEAFRRMVAAERVLDLVDCGLTGKVALPPGQQSALSSYWAHRAPIAWMLGDRVAADTCIEQALTYSKAEGAGFGTTFVAMFGANLAYSDLDPARVIEIHQDHYTAELRGRFPENDALFAVPLTWARSRLSDDPGTVDAVLGAATAAGSTPYIDSTFSWAMVADVALHHGRIEQAMVAVRTALEHHALTGVSVWLPEVHRLHAVALAAAGEVAAARAALERAEAAARATDAFALEGRIAHTRFHDL